MATTAPKMVVSDFGRIVHGWIPYVNGSHVIDDFGNSVRVEQALVLHYLRQQTDTRYDYADCN